MSFWCSKVQQASILNKQCFLLLQDCFTVPQVSQADSSAVSVRLQARGSDVPPGNTLMAVATYATPSGDPRTATLKASLVIARLLVKSARQISCLQTSGWSLCDALQHCIA